MARSRAFLVATFAALWIVGVVAGARAVWMYQTTPGTPADSPDRWPSTSALEAASGRPTLVLIAHPHCPCTRATVSELARLMSRLGDRVAAHVLVYRPREFAPGWERTDVWTAAERIPGVRVRVDVDGAEAARFGAATSGQVLLYDAAGRRRFSGGLTNARGHVGESPAQEQIAAVVEGRETAGAAARVYGCALAGPERAEPASERGGT